LKGYIRSVENEIGSSSDESSLLHVELQSAHANPQTLQHLLEYFYMDSLPHLSTRSRSQLLNLAHEFGIKRLIEILSNRKNSQMIHYSTYLRDMTILQSSIKYADIAFIYSAQETSDKIVVYHGKIGKCLLTTAHKVIIDRIPYFSALMRGNFADSDQSRVIQLSYADENNELKINKKLFSIDIDGLLSDGIDLLTFKTVILYAYTGKIISTGKSFIIFPVFFLYIFCTAN
jgi:hypothetical protein